jgi:DNA-binding MurR/RpiR family transcriptional regulator
MDLIRDSVDDCPPAEFRVAVALLGNGAAFGLRSSAELAAAVGTSQPSVIRFAQRLGYAKYSDFQTALRSSAGGEADRVALIESSYGGQVTAAIVETLAIVDPLRMSREFVKAKRVFATGGFLTHLAAQYLVGQLGDKRTGATLVPRDNHERAMLSIDLGRGDLVVLFDNPPYEPETLAFATLCKERGARLLLITDQGTSPIGPIADLTLRTSMVPLTAGDSLVPVFAVIDELMITLNDQLGRRANITAKQVTDSLHRLRRQN